VTVRSLPSVEAVAQAGLALERAIAGERVRVDLVFAALTLVIGSAQAPGSVDLAACAAAGVAVVRRGSGGGAVLCDDGLLEVDVAVPAGDPLAIADVAESYRWLGEAWVAALALVGVAARTVAVGEVRALDDQRRAAARSACYAGLSPYEVVAVDGRKLVGLAQRRRRGAVLYQCSVAVHGAPARVGALLRPVPGLAGALARTAALDELGVHVTVDALAAALVVPGKE
jgi:lipoate-protein ligase A